LATVEPTRTEFLFMEGPAWKAAFYGLMALSLGAMAWQFWSRSRCWARGRPIDWKPDYVGGLLKHVLGQRKVQGSRLKDGAPMHLMIFYGFFSLFVATTLLAVASYAPLFGVPNFHRGAYYLVYETVFDVLGLFFVAGVAWALWRRWGLLRAYGQPSLDPLTGKPGQSRNPLSHDRSDYWTLTLLLALGVTGYVLEGARISADPKPWDWASPVGLAMARLMPGVTPAAYIGIWWFHAVLVAAFFVCLPNMRIRHIVTATLTAAGAPSQPMGELKPVSMEEVESTGRIGVSKAEDYSRWHLLSLDACMSCGRCTEVCPAYNVGKPLNPKQVVADVSRALRTGEPVADAVSEDALWACTTCNACVEACPVLIRHVDMIVDVRRHLVAEGRFSGAGAVMLRQLGSTGHAWGAPASGREDWMRDLDVPLCREGARFDFLLWVGCAGATDPAAVRTTRSLARLLRQAGVSFACLGREETCTGDPARRAGDEFLFQDQASKNVGTFEKYGVQRVVTACPHCFNTFRNEYGQVGGRLEVYHHTQVLNELVQEGRLRPAKPAPGSVVLHDPCYLSRVNGESDAQRGIFGEEPRHNTQDPGLVHLLKSSPTPNKRLAEPEAHAAKTLCCGAGGGRMWMDEEAGKRPSERRLKQLTDTGAETIAVACPFCRIMLGGSLKEDKAKLVDVAELLDEANPPS
jgi:Fe-S oxidoreductase